ncbi:hypothetical protein Pint_15034 [Pistacia integerrima]|uniref:Uncharacterized protein n=1 Tax=Pistacia integerrima TaxID=434235 RepID=A0ACC0ZD76_9ROSI|nr:hypothetical protein Pint_15034 [Pistacia integerrima]
MNGASSPNGGAHNMHGLRTNGQQNQKQATNSSCCSSFQMPLHYPRSKKSDYETKPEWKLYCLLNEYGLPIMGDVTQKRKFAMGAFLWPNQV